MRLLMAFSVTVVGFVGTVFAPAGPQVLLSAAVLVAGAVATRVEQSRLNNRRTGGNR